MGLLSRWRRSPAARLESGLALMEAGLARVDMDALNDASEEFLRAARGDDPDVAAHAWLLLGRTRRHARDPERAAEYFRNAVASDHPEHGPHALLALADLERGFKPIEPLLRRAIATGHADVAPEAALDLGLVLRKQGDDAAAEPVLRFAVDSGHHDAAPRAMLALATMRRRAGAGDEADELCRRARDTGPRDVARAAREMLAGDSEPTAPAAAPQRASRRGPAQGKVCDFCSGEPVVATYAPGDLRAAAMRGFHPDFGPMAAMAGALGGDLDEDVFRVRWLGRVWRDDTPWAACGHCADHVDAHLP